MNKILDYNLINGLSEDSCYSHLQTLYYGRNRNYDKTR